VSARFKAGDRVRVRVGAPPGHFRTPTYIQGKVGAVERLHGDYRNPESLAYGGDGLPKRRSTSSASPNLTCGEHTREPPRINS